MKSDDLVDQGNQLRADNKPNEALALYAQAFVQDRKHVSAFNNYGNVLREIGDPAGGIPFLEHALTMYPDFVTAKFNLAVCHLLLGDYEKGWPAYEARWQYEHLAGTLPTFPQPRWEGEDLKDKTILVVGEQGHGDNIQFSRFIFNLHTMGAKIIFQVTQGLIPMFASSSIISRVCGYNEDPGEFDYWVPIMSIPRVLGITLKNLPRMLSYLGSDRNLTAEWNKRLFPKTKIRLGLCWSGRRDSWLNQHKSIPFDQVLKFVEQHPEFTWVNLQADCTKEEETALSKIGVLSFPGEIKSFADTAALLMALDAVMSVDTAVAHLAGSLGVPTWIMLNQYAVDWRWLLEKNSSPWYQSAVLFRQDSMDDWQSVFNKIYKHLKLLKI
jgi:tetratricopeptide (TPR) repeat protein